jgi:MFS family permease
MRTLSTLDTPQRARLQRWKTISLGMGIVAQLFLAGDWYGFAAVIPFISASLHLTPLQIGIVQGAFSITYALGMILWAALSTRMSTRALYCTGLCGVGLFMLVQAQAQSYEALVATRLAVGFFDAAVWIPGSRRRNAAGRSAPCWPRSAWRSPSTLRWASRWLRRLVGAAFS